VAGAGIHEPQNPALGPVGDALARATQSTAQVYRHDRGRVRSDGTCPHHRIDCGPVKLSG